MEKHTPWLWPAALLGGGGGMCDAGESCDSHLKRIKPQGSSAHNDAHKCRLQFRKGPCVDCHWPPPALLSFIPSLKSSLPGSKLTGTPSFD